MLTKEYILNQIGGTYQIYQKVIHDLPSTEPKRILKPILSPFRNEKNASFHVFKGKDQNWYHKDHGGDSAGDAFKFWQQYYGAKGHDLSNFNDCLVHIAESFNIEIPTTGYGKRDYSKDWEAKHVPFSDATLEFFKLGGIEKEVLERYNVQQLIELKIKREKQNPIKSDRF